MVVNKTLEVVFIYLFLNNINYYPFLPYHGFLEYSTIHIP